MTRTSKTILVKIEDEPPGASPASCEDDEKPPSTLIKNNRHRFFGDISDDNWNDWRWQFRNRLTSIEELTRFFCLSKKEQEQLSLVTTKYPLSITPYYLSLIDLDNPEDPIKKQSMPSFQEVALAGVGHDDPLGEVEGSPVRGLVHRYPDRVLVVLTNLCPMLCRHCTRKREWHDGPWIRTSEEIDAILQYINGAKGVRDVILSGGDPLTLSTQHLESVISRIRQIKHVEIIRIGSRFPVVLPQRIDHELCNMLSKYGPIWLNTHFNHPREITPESANACDQLLRSGVPVNNQSVLLKGINDSVNTQMELCQGLLRIKVRPYYLYQCDEVRGTEHLRTPIETGLSIIQEMRGYTSGLAVPTFVIDLPHNGGKVPVQPNYVLSQDREEYLIRNYEGRIFRYRNPAYSRPHSNGNRNGRNGTTVDKRLPKKNGTSSLRIGV